MARGRLVMRTPVLPLLFRLGLGITGLYLAYAAIILPTSASVVGGAELPMPDLLAKGLLGLMGVLLMFVAGKAIWEQLDLPREEPRTKGDDEEVDEPVAICTTCLAEVNPLDHYCPTCGDAVGRYTGYVPFVNIPFEFNFLGRVWHRVWREPGVPINKRAVLFAVMIAIAPIMLIGLPFLAFERLRPRRKRD